MNSDREYCCYSFNDLKRFLNDSNISQKIKIYKKDGMINDNYSSIIMGYHLMWTAKTAPAEPTFGIISGDLRDTKNTSISNVNVMNFCITSEDGLNFQLHFIEPNTNKIIPPINNCSLWDCLL